MSVRPHPQKHLPKHKDKWHIDYYPQGRKGKRHKITFRGNEASARAYELELRRDNSPIIPVNPKIADAFPDWLKDYKNNHLPNTYRDVINCLKAIIPFFGSTQFSRLTPTLIEQYKTKRLEDGVGKRTINKELSYLSGFIGWAVDNNFAKPLWFKLKKFPKIKSPKPHILHPDEIENIIQNIEKKYQPMMILLYDTGVRRTEALQLKAEDIDLNNRYIMVKGKGEKERIVPIMTERLFAILQTAIQERKKGYLFLNPHTQKPYYSIRKSILRAVKKAGIDKRVYHHLFRHSFITHAIDAGMGLNAVQSIAGHSTVKTTEGYVHLLADYLKREGTKFQDYISNKQPPQHADIKEKSKKRI